MLHQPRPSRTRVPADQSDHDPQAVSAAGLLGAAVIVLLLAALL